MKYNYPIKYAAMPIIEQVGWSHGLNELERNYDIVCYIVSKCYLLSDKTKYKENGEREKEYEVVFPYQPDQYHNWERVTPSFNLLDYSCTNSRFVKEVFDSYEEALEIVNKKNTDLCDKTWIYLPYTEDFINQVLKKKEEFNDKLSKYKILEQQILVNTSDLEQSNVRELDKLIIVNGYKTKIISSNLYEYLNLSSYSSFIAYSISKEEYDKFIVSVNSQDIPNDSKIFESATPILYHIAGDENIMVIDKNGKILYYIDRCGCLIKNDEQKISDIELKTINDKYEIFFTTEKLEDIVVSFNVPNEIQVPVLKKTLSDKNSK